MAVSGVITWNPTRNDILYRALRIVNAYGTGETPTAEDISNGQEASNALMKSWQSEGIRIFTTEQYTRLVPTASLVDGTDSEVYECRLSHTSSTDDKPITGDTYATYWFKSSGTSAAWAADTSYTSNNDFAMPTGTIGIMKATIREAEKDHDLQIVSYENYLDIADKVTTGRPYQISVLWDLTPRAYLYPRPDKTTYTIDIYLEKLIDDFTSQSETAAIPREWINALIFGLAYELSYEYPVTYEKQRAIEKRYKELYKQAKGNDRQNETEPYVGPAY